MDANVSLGDEATFWAVIMRVAEKLANALRSTGLLTSEQ